MYTYVNSSCTEGGVWVSLDFMQYFKENPIICGTSCHNVAIITPLTDKNVIWNDKSQWGGLYVMAMKDYTQDKLKMGGNTIFKIYGPFLLA